MEFDKKNTDISWCPGCGNFSIIKILKEAITELNISEENLVLVSGIGQAAKLPQYLDTNYFNGLHGRALPPATAIKAVNPNLNVILTSGEGDMYGEGGNHFIHNIRRNPNLTAIVHNNMVYGLTKGQASPTTQEGFATAIQVKGVSNVPFNPIATALAQDASFVARAYCGDVAQTKEIFKKAILHKGFALVDTFQPCVTFNIINTYQWFKQNTYYLEDSYVPDNKVRAFERALETEKLPLGIFYADDSKTTFEETASNLEICKLNVFERRQNRKEKLKMLMESYV
jgi:2-oxoglutarate ferredoxin oxidoreductase subunit beta